jgi:DNA-directed RNA polymerase subunit RPC12/RpoP
MSDSTRDLLVRGIAAAKAGEVNSARFFLERLLNLDPSLEECVDAWYWLSEISTDAKEQRNLLESILANDPADGRARRKLAILDGKLNPVDIIDPDKLVRQESGVQKVDTDRFICPQCGGKMVYAPDGKSLTCEYCEARSLLVGKPKVLEQDFTAALATARGHVIPADVQTFDCQGCGANFILLPGHLTQTCPYCDSAYVVRCPDLKQFLPPSGLIPFHVSDHTARQAAQEWIAGHTDESQATTAGFVKVFFPFWAFEVGGMLKIRYLREENDCWIQVADRRVIGYHNQLVRASRQGPEICQSFLDGFDLDQLIAYDSIYLVDCIAQTYQIAVSDAALSVRKMTLDKERKIIRGNILGRIKNLTIDTSDMIVEAFKLILLPIWISHYFVDGQRYEVLVNGQTGDVCGSYPQNGLSKLWGDLKERLV